jgi:hypothetical protein
LLEGTSNANLPLTARLGRRRLGLSMPLMPLAEGRVGGVAAAGAGAAGQRRYKGERDEQRCGADARDMQEPPGKLKPESTERRPDDRLDSSQLKAPELASP